METPTTKLPSHIAVFDLDRELISGKNHSDRINIVAVDTNEFMTDYQKHNSLEHAIWNALSYDSLHIPSSSSTDECAMHNGTWQGG